MWPTCTARSHFASSARLPGYVPWHFGPIKPACHVTHVVVVYASASFLQSEAIFERTEHSFQECQKSLSMFSFQGASDIAYSISLMALALGPVVGVMEANGMSWGYSKFCSTLDKSPEIPSKPGFLFGYSVPLLALAATYSTEPDRQHTSQVKSAIYLRPCYVMSGA